MLGSERYPRGQNTGIHLVCGIDSLTKHDLVIGLGHSDNLPFQIILLIKDFGVQYLKTFQNF